MTAPHSISSGSADALALADEIDMNFKIGAEHRFSDSEARIIQAALRTPAPPFARWANIIESASLTINPQGSKELNALAAEVRAWRCSEKAAYTLMLAGLLPKEASAQEIALAEKLAKEFTYLRDAAYELRVILNARTKF